MSDKMIESVGHSHGLTDLLTKADVNPIRRLDELIAKYGPLSTFGRSPVTYVTAYCRGARLDDETAESYILQAFHYNPDTRNQDHGQERFDRRR